MAHESPVCVLADKIAIAETADVYFFSADIEYGRDIEVINDVRALDPRRQNIYLILVTPGGNPDVAYRIARCFREKYKDGKLTLLIPGECKSAGTLMALAADEIVMSDYGELGPLDIQVAQPDDLGTMNSGLTATTALAELRNESFLMFEKTFMEIKRRSFGQISFKTATEIACNLTVGLFAPIYQQIQAMQLGEVGRANRISGSYGRRLAGSNLRENAIDRLSVNYPSHSFVIDRKEAKVYFSDVREPNEIECELFKELGHYAMSVVAGANGTIDPWIEYLSTPLAKEAENEHKQNDGKSEAGADRGEQPPIHTQTTGGGSAHAADAPASGGNGAPTPV